MIVRAGFGMGIINILVSIVQTPMKALVLRLLNGVVSGFIPSAIALVATNTPEDKVGTSLGILKTGSATGNVLGLWLEVYCPTTSEYALRSWLQD